MQVKPEELEVGYNIPAMVGMEEAEIQTPCLVLDLDALERNIIKMGQFAKDKNKNFINIKSIPTVRQHHGV